MTWRRDYKKEDVLAIEKSTGYSNDSRYHLDGGGRLTVCVIEAGVLSVDVIYWRLPRKIRRQALWLPSSLFSVRLVGMCSYAGVVLTSDIKLGR